MSEESGRAPARRWRVVLTTVAITLAVVLAVGGPIESALSDLWDAVFGVDEQEHAEGKDVQYYTCGMHPWVILPHPGDCPICHMELTPLDPDKFTGEIAIDPVVTQNMGVRIADVEKGPLVRSIRTVGTVAYDETRVRDINLKVGGWIEKMHVDYLGAPVEVGETLFDLYSPELFSAQEEYLAAFRQAGRGSGAAASLLDAARTRLRFFDITDAQIGELERRGEPAKSMAIASPWPGLVVAKHANEGMKVTPGMQIYRVADLSKVWVMVTLYEYQLPYVSLGQEAVMTLPYIPGQEFRGRVLYIYPYLSEKTREVKARIAFENPELLLKPGMFANVEIRSTLAEERTLVPREAVIDTGERQVAFVSLGEGKFEPRDVEMGVEAEGGRVEIRKGLEPGEKIVVSGQFLLDSEARIREGLAKMIRGDLASEQKEAVAVAGASELKALPRAVADALGRLLDAYFAIGDLLASDTLDGVAEPARKVAAAVDALIELPIEGKPHFWHEHDEAATVRGKALELVSADDLAGARERFADLSTALDQLVRATGVPPGYAVEVQGLHCPMYREGQGGTVWLQKAGPVRNPYYGTRMLECFDERATLPRTGATGDEADAGATRGDEHEGHAMAMPVSATRLPTQEVDQLFEAYLALQEQLAGDRVDGADDQLRAIGDAAAAIGRAGGGAVAELAAKLNAAASAEFEDIAELRVRFKDLSDAAIALAAMAPPSRKVAERLRVAHCPMANADWLQRGDAVSNPYYGADMLTCGSIERVIEGSGTAAGSGDAR